MGEKIKKAVKTFAWTLKMTITFMYNVVVFSENNSGLKGLFPY